MSSPSPADVGHADMDYAEHDRTYALFIGLTKWVSIGCVAVLVLLAWMTL